DFLRAMEQQRTCKAAGTGADLYDGRARKVACGPGNLAGQVEVQQEILAERLLRRQPMALDHFAQRRQAVDAHRAPAAWSASCRASFSAATKLSGFAPPVPASAKAVP